MGSRSCENADALLGELLKRLVDEGYITVNKPGYVLIGQKTLGELLVKAAAPVAEGPAERAGELDDDECFELDHSEEQVYAALEEGVGHE